VERKIEGWWGVSEHKVIVGKIMIGIPILLLLT